jgi:hypothetical protein
MSEFIAAIFSFNFLVLCCIESVIGEIYNLVLICTFVLSSSSSSSSEKYVFCSLYQEIHLLMYIFYPDFSYFLNNGSLMLSSYSCVSVSLQCQ